MGVVPPQCRPPTKCCWKGHHRYYDDVGKDSDCTDVVEEIYPEPGDAIIEKYGYGAFTRRRLLHYCVTAACAPCWSPAP